MTLTKKQQGRLARLLPGGVPRYVRIYDNGGASADRYTVVFSGNNPRWEHPYMPGWGRFSYPVLGISDAPFWPQGVCLHSSYPRLVDRPKYGHLGKKIKWSDLNADCQRAVLRDYLDFWELPEIPLTEASVTVAVDG